MRLSLYPIVLRWWFKPALGLLLCWPAAALLWGAVHDTLGANPAEALIRGLGDWALRWLWLALAITPLRQWLQWPALARLRRITGLFAAGYAALHVLAYVWLDQGWDWVAVWADIGKRPFILVGALAFALLLPLVATSFDAAIRALGGQRWRLLHRSVYAVGVLVLLHFWWMRAGKNRYTEVLVYAGILIGLLGWRLWHRWSARKP